MAHDEVMYLLSRATVFTFLFLVEHSKIKKHFQAPFFGASACHKWGTPVSIWENQSGLASYRHDKNIVVYLDVLLPGL